MSYYNNHDQGGYQQGGYQQDYQQGGYQQGGYSPQPYGAPPGGQGEAASFFSTPVPQNTFAESQDGGQTPSSQYGGQGQYGGGQSQYGGSGSGGQRGFEDPAAGERGLTGALAGGAAGAFGGNSLGGSKTAAVAGALIGAFMGHKGQDKISDWRDDRKEEERRKEEEEERRRKQALEYVTMAVTRDRLVVIDTTTDPAIENETEI
ncbi:hypothetical protein PG997_012218 [Apiospora hydei]|uniref:Glycine zipper 2TM domain-containing protein n=1 Tax=Apiospora hydei TaxID=1337664 RepID=A0ABR1V2Q1_9PEZI